MKTMYSIRPIRGLPGCTVADASRGSKREAWGLHMAHLFWFLNLRFKVFESQIQSALPPLLASARLTIIPGTCSHTHHIIRPYLSQAEHTNARAVFSCLVRMHRL